MMLTPAPSPSNSPIPQGRAEALHRAAGDLLDAMRSHGPNSARPENRERWDALSEAMIHLRVPDGTAVPSPAAHVLAECVHANEGALRMSIGFFRTSDDDEATKCSDGLQEILDALGDWQVDSKLMAMKLEPATIILQQQAIEDKRFPEGKALREAKARVADAVSASQEALRALQDYLNDGKGDALSAWADDIQDILIKLHEWKQASHAALAGFSRSTNPDALAAALDDPKPLVDPISGEPSKLCPPYTALALTMPVTCAGCGAPVQLDAKGAWEHIAETITADQWGEIEREAAEVGSEITETPDGLWRLAVPIGGGWDVRYYRVEMAE